MAPATDQLRAYVEYLRDMGIHDLYRRGEPLAPEALAAILAEFAPPPDFRTEVRLASARQISLNTAGEPTRAHGGVSGEPPWFP